MEGITGQFYKQFGVTVATATMLSTVVSLTLSPALAAILMKAPSGNAPQGMIQKAADIFNRFMDRLSGRYSFIVGKLVRLGLIVSVVYIGLIALTGLQFSQISKGFIPPQDQGYMSTAISLPPGASLERTDKMVKQETEIILSIPGVAHVTGFTGFSGATFTNMSNAGALFIVLEPQEERRYADEILADVNGALFAIDEAFIMTFPPAPVPGIGSAGGFKMMIQDRAGKGSVALEQVAWSMIGAANQAAETQDVYTFFETGTPRIYLDIDRDRARRLNVPLQNIFSELEANFGSAYVNDFNLLGRTFRVTAQADAGFRLTKDDILRLRVRSTNGKMVAIGSIATIQDTSGPPGTALQSLSFCRHRRQCGPRL